MSQPVGTLVKAMDVLDALGESAPIGVLELSRRLKMDKSAVSRILTTFRMRDYVRVVDGGRYDIGPRLFELGQVIQERMPFRAAVIPYVDAIARDTGETAFAVHYSQGQIAYLYDCVSAQDIRLGERVGRRDSPWDHPAGKAILAQHDEAAVFADLSSAHRTGRAGLPSIDSFRRELSRVRRQGYASQRDAETSIVAVPVLNDTGPVSAALMVGGPVFRLAASQTKSLARLLVWHAREVSRSLGWIENS